MKILLINNHTKHLKDLSRALAGHEVEVQEYRPGLNFHSSDKDLIILSGGGGEGLEIYDKVKKGKLWRAKKDKLWYEDQMKFVLKTKKPIIGICMGFEVICSAFGAHVEKMPKEVKGNRQIAATEKGKNVLGSGKLVQYESHEWRVRRVPLSEFEVLAESETGVEAVRHKSRPIFATQFHPEIPSGTLELSQLLSA